MDFNNNKAIYLQIADNFCEKILRKEFSENDRIPSVRAFAISYEVNPNTVMRAYTYLQEKEIIFNKRGIGYFIAEGAHKKTLKIKKEEFLNSELPSLFKAMKLLNINLDEISKKLNEFENKKN